jgi:hypothetical protein
VARGTRPAVQLHRWVSQPVFAQLQAKANSIRRHRRGTIPPSQHVRVRRVRISRPVRSSVEAAVVIDDGKRPQAVAIRLDWRHERWIASDVTFL